MMGGLSFGGRLFLIELGQPNDVDSTNQRQESSDDESSVYYSEYAIESGQGDGLCHPIDYAIDYSRKVHVIVTAKNLGKWVMKLIEEFEQLQQKSGDRNIQIILADFNSTDTDLVYKVNSSKIGGKVKIRHMGDKYNKGMGIKTAVADLVQNPEDIIFLCDLHLEIPTTFLNDIRKHVIQYKMVFAPVVGKLEKGSSPSHPHGVWDTNGFGVVAITRADWNMIGGMNTEDFKGDQWGGEDWDMIDRIVASGLLVNRRRIPGLLHHFHDKKDMWTGGRYHLVGGGAPGPGHGGRRAEMEYKTPAPRSETADDRRDDVLRMDGIEELHFGAGPRGGKYNMSSR